MDILKRERRETRPACQHPHQKWSEWESHQGQQGRRKDKLPLQVHGPQEQVRPRETTPGFLPPSRRRPWKRQRSVERNLTRSCPCHACLKRLQYKAHTRQIWSRIERRANAEIDIINLSRRTLSPSELKVLGRIIVCTEA